jgi:hypothetical protein
VLRSALEAILAVSGIVASKTFILDFVFPIEVINSTSSGSRESNLRDLTLEM